MGAPIYPMTGRVCSRALLRQGPADARPDTFGGPSRRNGQTGWGPFNRTWKAKLPKILGHSTLKWPIIHWTYIACPDLLLAFGGALIRI